MVEDNNPFKLVAFEDFETVFDRYTHQAQMIPVFNEFGLRVNNVYVFFVRGQESNLIEGHVQVVNKRLRICFDGRVFYQGTITKQLWEEFDQEGESIRVYSENPEFPKQNKGVSRIQIGEYCYVVEET